MEIYTSTKGIKFEVLPSIRWKEATHWLFDKYPDLRIIGDSSFQNRKQTYDAILKEQNDL